VHPSILGGAPELDSPNLVDSIVPVPRLAPMPAGVSAEASPRKANLRSVTQALTEQWSRVRPQEILRWASAPTQGRFVPIDKLFGSAAVPSDQALSERIGWAANCCESCSRR
jgi:hypothetical protein